MVIKETKKITKLFTCTSGMSTVRPFDLLIPLVCWMPTITIQKPSFLELTAHQVSALLGNSVKQIVSYTPTKIQSKFWLSEWGQRLLKITGDYWRLLKITGDYWRLLEITGDYWRLLEIATLLMWQQLTDQLCSIPRGLSRTFRLLKLQVEKNAPGSIECGAS